jgi:sulfane dehydrogenase subunit SoxC
VLSRRKFLSATSGIAGTVVAGRAAADTLADVPPREPGADLSGHSERSRYVQISRIPEAGPGKRNVDPSDAINSKTPLDKLVGALTPSDLHYERSHAGVPDLDPAKHRLLIHGMTEKQLVLTVGDLKAMPSVSRTVFIECTGNGWENWKKADESLTVQNTHGLVSTNEWTGVPLKSLVEFVGKDRGSNWMLAEGGDAAGVARSIPLTDEIMEEAFIAYGQNGEPLRPAHGFPIRLVMPGFEGNLNIKWLRRLKFGDQPWMTLGNRALYPAIGRRQGQAVSAPDGDQLGNNLSVRNDADCARIQSRYRSCLERPWQDRQGRGLYRRRQNLEAGATQRAGAAEDADPISD